MAGKLTRLRLNQGIAGVFYIMHNIAQEIGAFEQEGLEIQTSTSELGAQVGLLDRGEVDLTIGGPMRTLRLQANEGKLLVNFCSAVRASPWMLLGRTREPELTPNRLVGKNVIDFKEAPTPILCLRYWLRQGGVQPEQVHFRNDLSMPDAVTAFLAGEGDYLLHSLHSVQPLLDSGQAHVALDLATALGGIPWSTYYATPATMAAKREELDAFTRAIYRAERWLHGHGAAEVARLVGKYYPHFDEGTLTRAIAYYQGNEIWPRDPLVPREDIDRFQDVLFDSGWISRRVPYEDQVDTGFAERAVKALGSA
ncbi:MAG: ABC transporter substrate-binding protein [Chloroflexi bacterium]|nr:ABC transporter substrate-binding protein [Chloroflexota bacterium]